MQRPSPTHPEALLRARDETTEVWGSKDRENVTPDLENGDDGRVARQGPEFSDLSWGAEQPEHPRKVCVALWGPIQVTLSQGS